jgi:hypothetical protein
LEFHKFVTSFPGITSLPIHHMSGWEWTGFQQVTMGWTLPLKKWRMLSSEAVADQLHLNRRWGCELAEQDWIQFWNCL